MDPSEVKSPLRWHFMKRVEGATSGVEEGTDGGRWAGTASASTSRRLPACDSFPPLRSLLLIEIHTVSDAARVASQKFVFPDFGIAGRHSFQTLRVAELANHLWLGEGTDAGFKVLHSWWIMAGEQEYDRYQRYEDGACDRTDAPQRGSEGKRDHHRNPWRCEKGNVALYDAFPHERKNQAAAMGGACGWAASSGLVWGERGSPLCWAR
jgi:hypothetical protein